MPIDQKHLRDNQDKWQTPKVHYTRSRSKKKMHTAEVPEVQQTESSDSPSVGRRTKRVKTNSPSMSSPDLPSLIKDIGKLTEAGPRLEFPQSKGGQGERLMDEIEVVKQELDQASRNHGSNPSDATSYVRAFLGTLTKNLPGKFPDTSNN